MSFRPYSNSRIALCPESRYRKYTLKEKGTNATRFDTDLGKHVHHLLEMYVKILVKGKHGDVSDERLVNAVVRADPSAVAHANALHEALRRFRDAFHVSPDRVIGVELKVAVNEDGELTDYDGKDAFYRGVIDFAEVDADGVVVTWDYKNYPRIHSNEELSKYSHGVGFQLCGYAFLLSRIFESDCYRMGVVYTRYGATRLLQSKAIDGEWQPAIFYKEDLEDWWVGLKNTISAIESLTDHPAIPSSYNCQYCQYVDTCSALQASDVIKSENEASDLLDRYIVETERVKRIKTRLDNHAKSVGDIESLSAIHGHFPSTSISYNTETLKKVLTPEEFDTIVSVDKKKLAKLLKTMEDDRANEVMKAEVYTTKTRLETKSK